MQGIVDIQIEATVDGEKARQIIDLGYDQSLSRAEVIANIVRIADVKKLKIITEEQEYSYQAP